MNKPLQGLPITASVLRLFREVPPPSIHETHSYLQATQLGSVHRSLLIPRAYVLLESLDHAQLISLASPHLDPSSLSLTFLLLYNTLLPFLLLLLHLGSISILQIYSFQYFSSAIPDNQSQLQSQNARLRLPQMWCRWPEWKDLQ
jgi:hypothetical protein